MFAKLGLVAQEFGVDGAWFILAKLPPHFPHTPERIPHQLGMVLEPVAESTLAISLAGTFDPEYACWIAVMRLVIPELVSSTGREAQEKT